ncbi:CELL WALL INTEGRITY/STRESS RESPONSE COMPONENT-LIKE PROTEIN [Salix viminalis]|uniref:CELL WALL INTEGRITY/STRESS RESPONSE COMPONENT-LIKE PROTEIN n=1 Tax=Salix viminalis TaxID=40686 RepID=A0A9Q0SHH6_SALVM|nr:CELL WALL INTEGRITY/STRESS RESPONSE COMPONENT-LIKE PROTEIN [Salix viminalis]
MAPLKYLICFSRQAQLLLFLVLFMFVFLLHCASSDSDRTQLEAKQFLVRRRMLEVETYGDQVNKKKSTNLSTKNQTKLAKPSLSAKNQTKLVKASSLSTKNQTKITKSTNSTKATPTPPKSISQLKKLNSTSKAATNSASTKKTSDLLKLGSSTNKTTKPTSTKQTQSLVDKKVGDSKGSQKQTKTTQNKNQPGWVGQDDEDDDLVAEFRDLPSKFHQTIIPDLERLSITSKKYLTKANKDLTKGFKPIVGNALCSVLVASPDVFDPGFFRRVWAELEGFGPRPDPGWAFAIGLHCYVAVFHRVVLHQPPKTNWKIHGIYATCFLVICLFANAERRKKAYLEEGGEEGKKN